MAQTTTNYGLYKPEATDTYNHLVYDNPNMDTIDATMKDNADHAIDSATCIKTGTVHSVTRTNSSCAVFRFTATGDWNTGDTMNVDGTPVSVFLPNGAAAINGAYVINTEVIASIIGTRVTLLTNAADATNINFDPTGTTLSSTNVEGALQELNDANNIAYNASYSVKQMIDRKVDNAASIDNGSFAATSVKDYLIQVCNAVKALSPGRYVFRHSYSGQWTALFVASVTVQGSDAQIFAVPLGISKVYIAFVSGLTTYAGESPTFTTLA